MPSLISSQEDSETKVVLHAKVLSGQMILRIWSPSGDNDNVILIILLLWRFKEGLILDDGQGKKAKKAYNKDSWYRYWIRYCRCVDWAPCVLRKW